MKSFCVALCSACVLVGALRILAPDGAVGKSVKYVLSLCFLTLVLSASFPKNFNISFNLQNSDNEALQAEELLVSSARFVYESALARCGINFSKITVSTDKSETNGIIISKITVYSSCPEGEIRKALGAAAENYEVVVKNE